MKQIFILCFFFLLLSPLAKSQGTRDSEYQKVLNKLSNKETDFMVPETVNWGAKGDTGFQVALVTPYMKKISVRYGRRLLPELVTLLEEDEQRDLAALVLLYAITKRNGLILRQYNYMHDLDKWRTERKPAELAYWKGFVVEK